MPARPERGADPNLSRVRGDAARDLRNWEQAVAWYRDYLVHVPDDAAIWIQFGHALKESDRLNDAENAYRSAHRLIPDDADLHLQIGHLMKRMNRPEQAVDSFALSLRLVPTRSVFNELVSLGREQLALRILAGRPDRLGPAHVYLQVTDLFNYLIAHKTVSGIQRVQLGVIAHVLALTADLSGNHSVVYNEEIQPRLWAMASLDLRAVVDYVSGASVDHATLKRLIGVALNGARAVRMRAGDACVITGSFWGLGGNPDLLRECNRSGVHCGVFFHDLLPVTHPDFFDASLVSDFRQSLYQTLALADFGLSNSEYTATEVRRFVTNNGLREIPVSPVLLAHVFKDAAPAPRPVNSSWPAAIAPMRDRPFVLCVCTIEVRKNHRYLFDIWKVLLAEGENVPDLVFVGRAGWRVGDFMAQLASTRYLEGRVRIVNDLSDEDLATLYRNCAFTAFPSIVEGWGLPIGESLSYGKVCVASNTSSMPEVGGDFVEYIDPLNLRDGIATIRRLIRNPEFLRAKEKAIGANFRPRNWSQVGADLIANIQSQRAKLGPKSPRLVRPRLPPGRPLSLSSDAADDAEGTQKMLRLALTGSWFPREPIGIWAVGNSAGLDFATELAPRTAAIVFLRINVADSAVENHLTLSGRGGGTTNAAMIAGKPLVIRFKTMAGEAGQLTVDLRVSGPVGGTATDPRPIRIGLAAFAYAAETDGYSRLYLLDEFLKS